MAAEKKLDVDEFLWLEDVLGERALQWVESKNQKTVDRFTKSESFDVLSKRLRDILDSDDRIPFVSKIGDYYYNFWQDANNPKGLLRRTTLEEYRKEQPDWETVLNVDELSRREDENWVYKGSMSLLDHDRTLINLSRGGSDAAVVREFDLSTRSFVDENGFVLAEAKSDLAWLSLNELLVSTDFGEGSLTESGYPRIVKLWRRGRPLSEAETIFEGETGDVAVHPFSDLTKGYEIHGFIRMVDFFNSELFERDYEGNVVKFEKPSDGNLLVHRNWLFVQTKTAWKPGGREYSENSLLAIDREAYRRGDREFDVLFEPSEGKALAGFSLTRNHVILNLLHNVQNELHLLTSSDSGWELKPLPAAKRFQSVSIGAVDFRKDDRYWSTTTDFLTPSTLSLGEIGKEEELLKQSPHMFDSNELQVSQHWVNSKDGTRVPYFLIGKQGLEGTQPTLLYGYGGFEISMLPQYMPVAGAAWMERGGVYVIANIRGGGEFGPNWHLSALRENRPRAYEDFIAVAEDLIARGVTTKSKLGAAGGSNGGLLMGNMLIRRPDLFGALAIAVPLIDMYRYHKLLAGASWVAEYGDPDNPEDWAFMEAFSPYHNLTEEADYPHLLVTTSTRDDRVHPGHARKLVAKLQDLGHDVWYYENTEGGHAGAADNSQRAFMNALEYEFLWDALSE